MATTGDQPCVETDLLHVEDIDPDWIDRTVSDLQPETWFFIERCLCRVTAAGS
jgi:hypothetical protein